jgi:O-antigen/teichoic acid export membrane protein
MALRPPGPHATAWVLAETAASAGFSLVSLLVIARIIGPHEAGPGALAIAAFLLADVAGGLLFTDALVQRRALEPRHLGSALTVSALVGMAAAAGLLGLAPLLPLSAVAGAASGYAMRGQRYRLLALRMLVGQPIALAAALAAAAGGLGAWAMVVNQAIATLLVFLMFLLAERAPLCPALDRAALADLWPVALRQLAAVVLIVGKYRLFVIALGLLLAERALAQARIAFRMVDAAMFVVWGAVARIAMPRLCAVQHDREALARRYGETAQLPSLIGLPLALGVALMAEDLIAALLGPAWADAAEAARVVALAAFLTFLHGDPFSLIVALGRARWNAWVALANLAVPLVAPVLLRPATPAGAALTWAAQGLLVTLVVAALVPRELGRSPAWLLRHAAPGVVAGAAMVAAVLGVQGAMAEAAPLARLLAAVCLGAATFLSVAWLALGRRLPAVLAGQGAAQPAAAA